MQLKYVNIKIDSALGVISCAYKFVLFNNALFFSS